MPDNAMNHAAAATDFFLTMLYTDGDQFKVSQTVLLQNDLELTLDDAQEKLDAIGREDILAEQWGLPNLAPYSHEYSIPEHEVVNGCYVDISLLELAVPGRYYDGNCLLSDVIRNIEHGGEAFFMMSLRKSQESLSPGDLQKRVEDALSSLLQTDGYHMSSQFLEECVTLYIATAEERRPIVIAGACSALREQLGKHHVVVISGANDAVNEQLQQRIAVIGGITIDTEALILHAREKCMDFDKFIMDEKNERPKGAPVLPFRKKLNKKARRMHR